MRLHPVRLSALARVALVSFVALGVRPDGSAAEYRSRRSGEALYLWTASTDSTQPDFLAVLASPPDPLSRRGRGNEEAGSVRLITTLPVPGRRNVPHHTEYELAPDRRLFASGYGSGRTFIFDLTSPAAPRLAGEFGDIDGYSHPHSYIRLPNGNVLATFQMRHASPPVPLSHRERGDESVTTGGLVELTLAGRPVRSSSANAPGLHPGLRVYSAAVVPALDRIVTTTTDMEPTRTLSREIQIWRLSDLALLHTITLPNGPAGTEAQLTAEPRVLADGRTVLVSTFNCGLYLLDGLASDAPSGRLVGSFPRKEGTFCAVPVVVGRYYLVTVPAWSAVVSLDVSDPAAPREVGRVTLGAGDVPHWIAVSPDQRRVVVTGYGTMRHRVLLLRFDPATGTLSLDERFREPGASEAGYRMDDKTWPHGGSAKGMPHGAVFGTP